MLQMKIVRKVYTTDCNSLSLSDKRTNSLARVETVLRFPANPVLIPINHKEANEEDSNESLLDIASHIMDTIDAKRFATNVPKGKFFRL